MGNSLCCHSPGRTSVREPQTAVAATPALSGGGGEGAGAEVALTL